jgi:hypothetical protein
VNDDHGIEALGAGKADGTRTALISGDEIGRMHLRREERYLAGLDAPLGVPVPDLSSSGTGHAVNRAQVAVQWMARTVEVPKRPLRPWPLRFGGTGAVIRRVRAFGFGAGESGGAAVAAA